MLDERYFQNLFNQIIEIWAKPEIEKRKNEGRLDEDFKLSRIQVNLTLGKPPEVKLDDELKIIIKGVANRNITKGELVKWGDLKSVESFTVEHPKNSAYIALFQFAGKWTIIFDFEYNKERKEEIKFYINNAKNFYNSAKDDLNFKRLAPFYNNCWYSAEMSAICHIIMSGDKTRGHGLNIKNFIELKNNSEEKSKYAKLLNDLQKMRRVQYCNIPHIENQDHDYFLREIKEMVESAEKLTRL